MILRPLRHARYYVHGAGVEAIIRGDGSVQWRDNSGLHIMGSQTRGRDGVARSTTWGLSPPDKLFAYDQHRNKCRRILERTRPLRELLHERWRRVALRRAAALLGVVLTRVEVAIEAGDDARAHA